MRSRSVGAKVLTATLDTPSPPLRVIADWEREVSTRLALEPGDVEPLSLARSRMRWPDHRRCVQSMADWTRSLGLPAGLLESSEVALMACRGARYHHDGAQYGASAFCNLFVSEAKGLVLHFPGTGQRMPLVRGCAVLFDTAQPHAVVRQDASVFDPSDFAPGSDCTQVFLTWELPIEQPDVARALGIDFDVDAETAARLEEEQVRIDGARETVDPACGRWTASRQSP
ncbi:hypothetical protein QTH87_15980 [Variovorax sp. J22P168]|uniref:hypothetical protein n=1 Tax=Variovorax jilinensis TaxID=3053513 RepID=UPI002577BC78|nr:hypothetical protein [Variovorax sp. J22P168]MDM0013934.1 hypothetical protein [Variovorax sp. J22P168]